jgi:hypothetical protein
MSEVHVATSRFLHVVEGPHGRELVAADGEFTDQCHGARMSRIGGDLCP